MKGSGGPQGLRAGGFLSLESVCDPFLGHQVSSNRTEDVTERKSIGFLGCERTESERVPELLRVLSAWERRVPSPPGAAARGAEHGGHEGVWGTEWAVGTLWAHESSHVCTAVSTPPGQTVLSVHPACVRMRRLPQRRCLVERVGMHVGMHVSLCCGTAGAHGLVGPGRGLQRPEGKPWPLGLVWVGLVPRGWAWATCRRVDI